MPYIPLAQRGRSNNSQISSLEEFKTRIANRESGGNYSAMGPVVDKGMYAGDRAVGKYQVMGLNVPDWTREALGRSMTAEEFKNSPEAQEAVATKRFTDIYNKYGNWEDVASVWFTGRPRSEAGGDVADVLGTTNDSYIASVVGGMGEGFNQLGQAASKYIPLAMRPKPYQPQEGSVSLGSVAREIPGEVFNQVVKPALKAPVRLGMVPGEVARGIEGKEPFQPVNLPILGETKSYGRQAVDDAETMGAFPAGLKAVSEGALETAGIATLAQNLMPSLKQNVGDYAKTIQPGLTVKPMTFTNDLEAARAHTQTAQQILDNNPNVPLPELLERTKINIVNGLKADGFMKGSNAVSKLDPTKYTSLKSFTSDVDDVITKALKTVPSSADSVIYDEPALAGLALPFMGGDKKELDIESLKFAPPPTEGDLNSLYESGAIKPIQKIPDIEKMEFMEPVKVVHEYKDKHGKVFLLKGGVSARPLGRFKPVVESVYKEHPNLPSGIIEAVLQKESSMGTNRDNYNPNIGEFAWLVGLTKGALKDLDNKGIEYDVDTKSGAIRAAAEYLNLRQKEISEKTGEEKFYTDARELYFNRYAPQADKKKDWKTVDTYVRFYGKDPNTLYIQGEKPEQVVK